LPDNQGEMSVEPAFDDFIGSRGDRCSEALVEQADVAIRQPCRLFDQSERSDQWLRNALLADPEVPARAFGLGAPISLLLHVDGSERIGFDTGRAFRFAQRTSLMRHAQFSCGWAELGGHSTRALPCDRMTYGFYGGITLPKKGWENALPQSVAAFCREAPKVV